MPRISPQHIAAQGAVGIFEPQRKFDWSFELAIEDAGVTDILSMSCHSMPVPTITTERIEIPFGNSSRWVAGKIAYEAVDLVLNDFVDAKTRQAVERWARQVRNPETESIGMAGAYKKVANLVMYGPNGTLESSWVLMGCWPTSVKYGEFDNSANDRNQITVNLSVDRVIPGPGIRDSVLAGINLGVGVGQIAGL